MAKTLSAPWILPAVQKALGVPGAGAGAGEGEGTQTPSTTDVMRFQIPSQTTRTRPPAYVPTRRDPYIHKQPPCRPRRGAPRSCR